MNWTHLLSIKRFGMEHYENAKKDERTEYQRDYDRLIFSSPFRRLQNKTQVFPLPGSVFVHYAPDPGHMDTPGRLPADCNGT